MNRLHGLILTFPKEVKLFLAAFVIVLSIGYFSGLLFVRQTESITPAGIQENYLGNEELEDAEVMKFRKGDREMLTIIHTHILSMSFIFVFIGSLVFLTSLPVKWKVLLAVEPFVSIILTFGGIYLMWSGVHWMRYVVMISGGLMTLAYATSACIVIYELIFKKLAKV